MAGMLWALFEYDIWQTVASIIYIFTTLFFFYFFCLPLLLGSALFLSILDKYWFNYLQKRFPQAEFINYSADSRRTHGISTAIIQVRGKLDFQECKRCFQELIEKKDSKSNLTYPRLRQRLIIRCGRFAWMTTDNFKLENHLVLVNPYFRARPVTIHNIHEYASELASKYLSSECPPWQVTIIPTALDSHYFILARAHEMLLSSGPNLAELLLLGQEEFIHWRPLHEDDENLPPQIKSSFDSHPLVKIQKPFTSLQLVCNEFINYFHNKIEQFIHKYDPVYNKKLSKTFKALICRLILASCRTIQTITWRFWMLPRTFINQSNQLQLTLRYVISCLLGTPKALFTESLSWTWFTIMTISIRMPMIIIRKLISSCLSYGSEELLSLTTPGKIRLFAEAFVDVCGLIDLMITAPGYILDELILSTPGDDHYLQTISLCGRKTITWSESVPLESVYRAASASSNNCTETEILLAATAGALREYFHMVKLNFPIPESLAITARAMKMGYLLENHKDKETTGLVCLRLPIGSQNQEHRELLKSTCESVNRARSRQKVFYQLTALEYKEGTLTSLLPSLVKRIGINYFTKRYAVRVTDLWTGGETSRRNHLGQPIEMFLYWPPPQANTSLSLAILRYGHDVRLAVMADSQLTPELQIIVNTWPKQLQLVASSQLN